MLQPLPCRFSPTDLTSPKQEAVAVPRSLSLTADNEWWEGRAGPKPYRRLITITAEIPGSPCLPSFPTTAKTTGERHAPTVTESFSSLTIYNYWRQTCALKDPNGSKKFPYPPAFFSVSPPNFFICSSKKHFSLRNKPPCIFTATLQLCLKSRGSQPESRNLLWAGQQPVVLSVPGMQSPFLSSPGSLPKPGSLLSDRFQQTKVYGQPAANNLSLKYL